MEQSHLATGMAFIMNISTLGMNVDPSNWDTQDGRRPSEGYQLPPSTKDPKSAPDLRAKSVVDTWLPAHQAFGQRLDSIASIMGQWGIGGWIDTYGPPLNYTTSGVSPSADELVLNLIYPDQILGWTIVVRAMMATANAWVTSGKLKNNPNVIERATGMGLTALLNRIGLLS